MRRALRAAALIALLGGAGSAQAQLASTNFNNLSPGTVVTGQYSGIGATFSLIPSPTEPSSPLPPPAGPTVWSLGPIDLFGVNGNSIAVGPSASGPYYDVQLDFAGPVDYFSIKNLDQERLSDLRILAYFQGQPVPVTVTSTLLGDVGPLPYVSGPAYLSEIGQVGGAVRFDRIVFGGTEQFDNLSFNRVAPTPESALAELLAQVTGVGPGMSLANKILQAQAFYAVPDLKATCAMLTGFVNEVGAQSGKTIAASDAQEFISDAQAIQTTIGCR